MIVQDGGKRGFLTLKNGMIFSGVSFGASEESMGEVVFNTGMVGYPEALSDPSYAQQILVLTSPMIGNYGVPPKDRDENGILRYFESEKVQIAGLVVLDHSIEYSHWNAGTSLSTWLKSNNIPALSGIDTRRLTKYIRENGVLWGKISFHEMDSYAVADFVNKPTTLEVPFYPNLVSSKDIQVFQADIKPKIMIIDFGFKLNILRYLLNIAKTSVVTVPFDYKLEDNPLNIQYDGVIISNGPGDPRLCPADVLYTIGWLMENSHQKPLFGICLGLQLITLAAGGRIFKMKYGNRGLNQPCIDLRTSKCYITSQNHGYAVDANKLPQNDWKPLFINANDFTCEGIIHISRSIIGVQFHPEACGGPTDTSFLFSEFLDLVNNRSIPRFLLPPAHFIKKKYAKVLLIGSGGLSIGQAGEFDYSGSQAIKALKEEGVKVILLNPNIATVQTSKQLGSSSPDVIYFLPIQKKVVEDILVKERPQGIIISMGGQTALNLGIELYHDGTFERYGCDVLGTPIESIIKTEDRDLFSQELSVIKESLALSQKACSVEEALEAGRTIGYPVLVRAAYALGGLGSGFAHDDAELTELAQRALLVSEQIFIDQDLRGWKEIEYEIIRDRLDNCIAVCNMENFDPLGVHTGDSIVVAPSQTLSNQEYFDLRAVSLKVVRHLGIVGECNIQYALDPNSHKYCIVEVNARLSRSSALASKATGYPLAYVAMKVCLGIDLLHIPNQINKATTACFEPSLDYCVVKFPKWDFSKFSRVSQNLSSSMSSVGEVMSIGRTFEEAIQKSIRMVSSGRIDGIDYECVFLNLNSLESELKDPTEWRIFYIQYAFEVGMSVAKIHSLTQIDSWFLSRLKIISDMKYQLKGFAKQVELLPPELLFAAKKLGFGDKQIARYLFCSEMTVRRRRYQLGLLPWCKQIDTLAAEYPAETNYLYFTYHGEEHDFVMAGGKGESHHWQPIAYNGEQNIEPSSSNGKVSGSILVLGCGAYSIGTSVEFDWCAVSAVRQLRALGYQAVVINYNPETVSTDFDESDVLFFEELTFERVMDIYELGNFVGVIVSVGGQIPNNLVGPLHQQGVRILGTSPEAINRAEDREQFSRLLDSLQINQPEWSRFYTLHEAYAFADKVGFPVLVRPSFVISGAAMSVAMDTVQLQNCLKEASYFSQEKSVVITKFIVDAKEIEFDGVAQAGVVLNYAISEHIENAGVHSGDATLVLPAQKLYVQTVRKIKMVASQIALALQISGPFNIQFLAVDNEVKVIECNLRASRTFPFVSKTLDANFISLATKVMLGIPCKPYNISLYDIEYVAVKAPTFSFSRLRGADPTLGVEMSSTGEVACFGSDIYEAFLQAMMATTLKLPRKHQNQFVLVSIAEDRYRSEFLPALERLFRMGFQVLATPGTTQYFLAHANQPITGNLRCISKPSTRSAYVQITGHSTKLVQDQFSRGERLSVMPMEYSHCIQNMNGDDENEADALFWIKGRRVALVVNIAEGTHQAEELTAGYLMRRAAVDFGVPLITNIKCASLFCEALDRKDVASLTSLSAEEFKKCSI